jgi:ankyrin repeat protein
MGSVVGGLSSKASPAEEINSAARRGDTTGVAKLLARDPNLVHARAGAYGQTPLMRAVRFEHLATAQYLLDHGARVHDHDAHGQAALHWASYKGSVGVVRLLLERGADPTIPLDHPTALVVAATHNRPDVVRLLLTHPHAARAINAVRSDGTTALWRACRNGKAGVARDLLARGAGVFVRTSFRGTTPLAAAVLEGSTEVVRLLLAHPHGALTIDVPDRRGETPLFKAAAEGRARGWPCC